jgi:hypothetical protein
VFAPFWNGLNNTDKEPLLRAAVLGWPVMNSEKGTVKFSNILLLLAFVAGCQDLAQPSTTDTGPVEFIVRVDSMSHPSFAATTDTITIRLFGTVGPDGCHSFSHFEDTWQPLRLDLTVWGQVSAAAGCPDVMVYLNGKEYKLVATQQGWLSINIQQPDGSILTDFIIVK